jgi:hypothetical protein
VYAYQFVAAATLPQIQFGPGTGLNSPVVSFRGYYRINVATPPGTPQTGSSSLALRTAAAVTRMRLRSHLFTDGTVELHAVGVADYGGMLVAVDTHHLVEMICKIGATDGAVVLKVNGVVVANASNIDVGPDNLDIVNVAGVANTGSFAGTVWWDDMVWWSDYAFHPPGRGYLIRLKPGTPLYDAFTKTGGTTFADVCSDVPFNTARFAQSSGTSQAQTGLIHGPMARGELNALQVAMIAKAGSGTTLGTYSIRRRVAGADTDTVKTLTTADAYYEESPWTALSADVDAAEIGAVRGTGGDRQLVVEDIGLKLDIDEDGHVDAVATVGG